MNSSTSTRGSAFVTSVGVCFLILGIASVLLTGIQFLLVALFVDQEALRAGMQSQHNLESLPDSVRFLFSNLKLISALLLGGSLLLTAASIGLLKRREWARWLFVLFMALGVVGHLAPLFSGPVLLTSLMDLLAGSPEAVRAGARNVVQWGWYLFAILSVLLAALFGWIGWKLTRPEIKAEFRR